MSEIGFGAWGIGGATPGATSYGPTDDRRSLRALERAFDLGVTFYDTSSVYGYGHSETLLGRAFRAVRERVVIATKGGLAAYGQVPDFSPDALSRSLEASLARLRTDYVDLLQLHNPPASVIAEAGAIRDLMEELKAAGRIRAFGLSLRAPEDGLAALRHARPDVIQVNLNLLDQRAIDCGLLAAAARAGTAIIARTPLCFGFLSNVYGPDARFEASDHRSRWPAAQIACWVDGAKAMLACREHPERGTAAQFALRFCLSFPEVSATIPGMLSAAEVEENVPASALGPLSAGELAQIAEVHRRGSFFVGAAGGGRPADPGKVDRA